MMLKLLTTLTIFSASLVVSTEAIFLQGLKHQIMCRIAKRRIERKGAKNCKACEKYEYKEKGKDFTSYFTSCEDGSNAGFGTGGAGVTFKNRDGQYVSFDWDEPGFFGRFGAPKCVAFDGEKTCKCEANLLATPIIPGPLSYKVSDCKL